MSRNEASVIVPVRNTPLQLFRACLDSIAVARHAYGRPVEVIIVDDRSDWAKFVEYQDLISDRYSNFRVVRLDQRSGIGGARNAGVTHASSDWLMFVDSDDTIAANCLLDLLRARADAAFIYANNVKVGRSRIKRYDKLSLFRIFQWALQTQEFDQLPILYSNHVCMPYILQREMFATLGGFREGEYSGEHVDLFGRLIDSGLIRTYVYIDKVLYYYHPLMTGNHRSNVAAHVRGKAAAFLRNSRLFGLSAVRYRYACAASELSALYVPSSGLVSQYPEWAIVSGGRWKLNARHEALSDASRLHSRTRRGEAKAAEDHVLSTSTRR